jgi:hypothetical protein
LDLAIEHAVVFTKASELEAPSATGAVLLSEFDDVLKKKRGKPLAPEIIEKIVSLLSQ